MHVFCAACYSGWMERSPLCPTCRCPVERIRKNHILNNLVEAYLIQHPGRLTQSAFWPFKLPRKRHFWGKTNPILWFLCASQRSAAARRTWRAWTAGTRLLRTCCSRKWSAPSLMRRAAQITCWNSQTTTATPQTWGITSVLVRSPHVHDAFSLKLSSVCPFCPQSANYDVQTVSRLQGRCQPAAVCYGIQLLVSWSASSSSCASSPQTSSDRGVCQSRRGAALNLLWRALRWCRISPPKV